VILCVKVVHLFKDAKALALSFGYMQTCVLETVWFSSRKIIRDTRSELPCCLLRYLNWNV